MFQDGFGPQISLSEYVKLFWERQDSTIAYVCVYEFHFTEKRFLWWWPRPARPSTHNTWNGGNKNGGNVKNNQNTGGNGGSNSWTGGNGNTGSVSNNQQGDVASPGKFTKSKAT